MVSLGFPTTWWLSSMSETSEPAREQGGRTPPPAPPSAWSCALTFFPRPRRRDPLQLPVGPENQVGLDVELLSSSERAEGEQKLEMRSQCTDHPFPLHCSLHSQSHHRSVLGKVTVPMSQRRVRSIQTK